LTNVSRLAKMSKSTGHKPRPTATATSSAHLDTRYRGGCWQTWVSPVGCTSDAVGGFAASAKNFLR